MRLAGRLLAILTLAALLAPEARWIPIRAGGEACPCSPGACTCACNTRASGHTPSCCAGKGCKCGLESHNSYLSSLLGNLIYVPTERPWWNPLPPWSFGHDTSDSSLLPSHERVPEQPPRLTL